MKSNAFASFNITIKEELMEIFISKGIGIIYFLIITINVFYKG